MKNRIDVEKGRYWDFGPVVVKGCTKISPGCLNCWSLPMTRRYQKGQGFVEGNSWTGKIETNHERLIKICEENKSSKIISLWNDLHHEAVNDIFKVGIHQVISGYPRHVFLILTKRPDRMLKFWQTEHSKFNIANNIFNGLTVCNQQEWNDKGNIFLSIPGNKFISHEPALERIDYGPRLKEIGCLIAGGETGPGARPSHPDIFRADRDQCESSDVDFFLKSLGKGKGRALDGRFHDDLPWVKPTCFQCGKEMTEEELENDATYYESQPYCENCSGDLLFACDNCGEIAPNEDVAWCGAKWACCKKCAGEMIV